jgi:hypothetical protein
MSVCKGDDLEEMSFKSMVCIFCFPLEFLCVQGNESSYYVTGT